MNILMFGWEFPPFSSGGLGTACYGLTKGLANHNQKVTFVLPKANFDSEAEFVKIVSADCEVVKVNSLIRGYMTEQEYSDTVIKSKDSKNHSLYGKTLYEEVNRYAKKGSLIAKLNPHDVIHAHDWLTYQAGIAAKKESGKPLVIHVHATEFDRTGNNPNPFVYDIERRGMHESDHIIAVSNWTKNIIIDKYGISPDKITVVHNAVEFNDNDFRQTLDSIKKNDKIVLFLGRITIQKGPDYFIEAAKKVLQKKKNVKFIVAGSGDMERYMIERAAELGIADKVLFTGFLKGKDIDRAYQMADLYVMPSVSEPFGITPLEAMRNKTPIIISRQSGVSEVVSHALKVDFWDIDSMADKILSVITHDVLHESLRENGSLEVKKFNWDIPASKCVDVYSKLLGGVLFG